MLLYALPLFASPASAWTVHTLAAWAQHEMVGVTQQDIGARVSDLICVQRFHGRSCADRHEGRCSYLATRRYQLASTGAVLFGVDFKWKVSHGAALAETRPHRNRTCSRI